MNNQNLLKHSNTNWKYILIVVILAVLVSGGIMAYERRINKEILSLEFSEIKILEKTKDKTANWKVYRDGKYNFEIRYPREWQSISVEEEYGYLVTFRENTLSPTYFGISVNLIADFPSAEAQCVKSEDIKIAGIKTRKTNHWSYAPFPSFQELTETQCEEDPSLTNIYSRIEKKGDIYEFVFFCREEEWEGKEGRAKCNHLYEQMLSSFRFL